MQLVNVKRVEQFLTSGTSAGLRPERLAYATLYSTGSHAGLKKRLISFLVQRKVATEERST